jgi:hypothetical protein
MHRLPDSLVLLDEQDVAAGRCETRGRERPCRTRANDNDVTHVVGKRYRKPSEFLPADFPRASERDPERQHDEAQVQ